MDDKKRLPDAGSIKLFGRPNSERALKEDIA